MRREVAGGRIQQAIPDRHDQRPATEKLVLPFPPDPVSKDAPDRIYGFLPRI